jgi:heme-degrading monooxygenase HmoA
MPYLKPLPANGFYAVIFSSTKQEHRPGYEEMDKETMRLAAQQPGYLGYESAGDGTNGIFISYWKDKASIEQWRQHATHQLAKAKASEWYSRYLSQICYVESSRLYELNSTK